MKYYIGYSKLDDVLKVIVYGMNPENQDGLVSRSSSVDVEEVFDDFAQYSARLLEFDIEIIEPVLIESPVLQEIVIDSEVVPAELSTEVLTEPINEVYIETIEHIETLETIEDAIVDLEGAGLDEI